MGRRNDMFKRCMGLVLAVIMICGGWMDQGIEKVEAASVSLSWPAYLGVVQQAPSGGTYRSTDDGSITVEAGAKKFYLGDYVYETGAFQNLSCYSGVIYKSNNTAVASVDTRTGGVTTKKEGKALIAIRYQKNTTTCTLNVVKKGSLKASDSRFTVLRKRAQALSKVYQNGVNISNCYEVNNQLCEMENCLPQNKKTVNKKGFLYEDQKLSNKLIVEAMGRYDTARTVMDSYVKRNDPIGTNVKSVFQIKSVSAKNSTISIKLNKNVSAAQIFGIKKSAGWDTELKKEGIAQFPLYVQEKATGYQYYGIATAKKGSNVLTVELYSKKLQKGRTYRLIGAVRGSSTMQYGWTKGKSFKSK